MNTTVIIPVRNGAAWLPRQLLALSTQNECDAFEVIVVDDGSTDGTASVALEWADRIPSIRVLPADGRGLNAARNTGARAASGKLLLFCDADDIVGSGWVAAMQRASGTGDLLTGVLERESLNASIPGRERAPRPPAPPPTALGFLPFAYGGNIGVKAHVVEALGGWDPAWKHAGSDEIDFSWRAQREGYAVTLVEDAIVHYQQRSRLVDVLKQAYFHGQGEPPLWRRYRDLGARRRRAREVARGYAKLLVLAPAALWSRSARRECMRRLGSYSGRIVGSVRARALYL